VLPSPRIVPRRCLIKATPCQSMTATGYESSPECNAITKLAESLGPRLKGCIALNQPEAAIVCKTAMLDTRSSSNLLTARDVALGSGAAHQAVHLASRLSEVEQTKFVGKLTFGIPRRLAVGKRPCSEAASHACC
jgi:hypothetical protein